MYRAVIDALPDCLYAKDLSGNFLIANPATAGLMKTTQVHPLGVNEAAFCDEAAQVDCRESDSKVLSTGKPIGAEKRFVTAAGNEIWFSTLKAPLLDQWGKTIGVVTRNREITERKRLEEDLQKSQSRLADAIESMADGLALCEPNGEIIFANRQFQDIFKIDAGGQAKGLHIRSVMQTLLEQSTSSVRPHDGNSAGSLIEALLQPGDHLVNLPDSRSMEARTRLTEDGSSMIVISDITAHFNRERRLRERNNKLEAVANTDPLTGLLNRRALDTALNAAVNDAKNTVSLLMIDVDRFKAFNDCYGHPEGDNCLRQIARIFMWFSNRFQGPY